MEEKRSDLQKFFNQDPDLVIYIDPLQKEEVDLKTLLTLNKEDVIELAKILDMPFGHKKRFEALISKTLQLKDRSLDTTPEPQQLNLEDISFTDTLKNTLNIGDEFSEPDDLVSIVNDIASSCGVRYKPRLNTTTNQFYLYCMHYGKPKSDIQSSMMSGCSAKVYAKFEPNGKGKKLIVKAIENDHKGHGKYTKDELQQMIRIGDIPKEIKEKALEMFKGGETCKEIFIALEKHFPNNKSLIEISAFKEVLKNYLYRNTEDNRFSMEMLLDNIREKYPDFMAEIRYDKKSKAIKDMFLTFRNRINQINEINKVIGIDPTYQVSKENCSLVVFVCVNKYYMTEIIAICFATEEKTENYEFALNSYESIGFKRPNVVFTDREKALCLAIRNKWPSTTHLLCLYHIYRNIQQHLGNVLSCEGDKFRADFSRVCKIIDQSIFEREYEELKKKYIEKLKSGKQDYHKFEKYLDEIKREQEKWAYCYTHKHFTAGCHSTQRNESMNASIKKYIRSCKRTCFTRLVEILDQIIYNTKSKVDYINLKIKTKNIQSNNDFEIVLNRKFAPIIAKKVINEYIHSFDYDRLSQPFPKSFVYEIKSLNPESFIKIYSINLDTSFCSCLKTVNLGIPCRHLYFVWRYTGNELLAKTNSSINKHWVIADQNENKVEIAESPNIKHSRIVSKDSIPDEIKSLKFQEGNNIKNNKSSKKRKEPHTSAPPEYVATSTKKTKLNNHKLFEFIEWKMHTCRYDVIVALFYFLTKNDPNILRTYIRADDIEPIFELIDNDQYSRAQTEFIKFAAKCKHVEDPKSFGSLVDLLRKIIQNDFQPFVTTFSIERQCTNTNCPYVREIDLETQGIFYEYSIHEAENKSDSSLIQGFIQNYSGNKAIEQPCSCMNYMRKLRSFHDTTFIAKVYKKLLTLPDYLVFGLETFIDENGMIKPSCAKIKIEEECSIKIDQYNNRVNLIAVVFFERNDHFTLAYKDPNFKKKAYSGWVFYDSIKGCAESFELNLSFEYMVESHKVPIILVYKILCK